MPRRKSDVSLCNSSDDIGSIGSNTFRENKRREFADYENEDDDELFNHHNNDVLQLFNNDHHNIMDDDDLNSAGSSLASYDGGWPADGNGGVLLSNMGIFGHGNEFGHEGEDIGPGDGSIRTKEQMRMSLIARRRRLAQMEEAMANDGDDSLDFSLRLNRRRGTTDSSVVSSLKDSIRSLSESLTDSIQGSLVDWRQRKKKIREGKYKTAERGGAKKDLKGGGKSKSSRDRRRSRSRERDSKKKSSSKSSKKRRDDSSDSD